MQTPFIAPDLEQGNIDLSYRKELPNPNGSHSTISSMSFGFTDENGKPFTALIPTVVNGKRLSPQQALDYFQKTGQHLGKFSNKDAADTYGKMLSVKQGQNPNTEPTIMDAVNRALQELSGGN